jgi:hypothetical protein
MERTAETSSAAAAERSRALVEARYALAMRRPRDVEAFRVALLKECDRPGFAEGAIYAKPVGRDEVKGLTVRFAEGVLRLYGNLDVSSAIAYDDATKRVMRVEVTDLETVASLSTEVVVEKTVERSNPTGRRVISQRTNSRGGATYLVEATEDEMLMKGEAIRSKALRSTVLRMVPGDIIEEARERCEKTMRSRDSKDPDASKRQLVDAFATLGVLPGQLCDYLGQPTLDVLDPVALRDLRHVYAALKSGETRWADVMEAVSERRAGGGASKKKESLTDRVKKAAAAAAPSSADADPGPPDDVQLGRQPGDES